MNIPLINWINQQMDRARNEESRGKRGVEMSRDPSLIIRIYDKMMIIKFGLHFALIIFFKRTRSY